ncbi:MAG: NADH-quinone oxidoreductase subunit K, partial [Pseudomonadota bacterium]|nr:NADH-quinone oxidoreductase subunit K [Pseudomonadota bacterium]
MIGLEHYLTVAATLFVIGVFGLFLNRKNVIILLMSIELMLLAVNNVIVVILGATVTSTFMSSSFSPLSDMQADSLVASQSGAQNVM